MLLIQQFLQALHFISAQCIPITHPQSSSSQVRSVWNSRYCIPIRPSSFWLKDLSSAENWFELHLLFSSLQVMVARPLYRPTVGAGSFDWHAPHVVGIDYAAFSSSFPAHASCPANGLFVECLFALLPRHAYTLIGNEHCFVCDNLPSCHHS